MAEASWCNVSCCWWVNILAGERTKNHPDQTQVRVDYSWSSRLDFKTQHFPNRVNPKWHGQVWANNKVIIKTFNLAHELPSTNLGVCWVTTPKYKNIRQFNFDSWRERFTLKYNDHSWLVKDFAFENGYLRRIAVECGKCWLWFSWSWVWPNLEVLITITMASITVWWPLSLSSPPNHQYNHHHPSSLFTMFLYWRIKSRASKATILSFFFLSNYIFGSEHCHCWERIAHSQCSFCTQLASPSQLKPQYHDNYHPSLMSFFLIFFFNFFVLVLWQSACCH